MKPEYQAWITAHVPTDPTGMCREITDQMAAAFPELRRVRGHYQFSHRERPWPHWWLVTADGDIVDPTVAQWPDLGGGEYIEHDESGSEPTGKCLECGAYVYDGARFCNAYCEAATLADLMGRVR